MKNSGKQGDDDGVDMRVKLTTDLQVRVLMVIGFLSASDVVYGRTGQWRCDAVRAKVMIRVRVRVRVRVGVSVSMGQGYKIGCFPSGTVNGDVQRHKRVHRSPFFLDGALEAGGWSSCLHRHRPTRWTELQSAIDDPVFPVPGLL